MNPLQIYKKFQRLPLGNYLFSKALCLKAPYFASISPRIQAFQEGHIQIHLPKKRSVLNHIGTVHAIAMCNLAELCGGLTLESVLPKQWRWIPKAMTVEYLAKANSDLVGGCEVNKSEIKIGDNHVIVKVLDKDQKLVFTSDITMYVSERKAALM